MSLPFRQIHLDFHTSEAIHGIGHDFDPERFAETLRAAAVNSVTLFSRCHHGWIYHDTRFAEARHPHLECNLLKLQLDACEAAGIAAPVYITVGWDERVSRLHPEWREYYADGRHAGPPPFEPGWHTLCFNTPYIDFVVEQTCEVMEMLHPVGIFFDIVFQGPCVCPKCLAGMRGRGLDPTDDAARREFADTVLDNAKTRLFSAVRQRSEHARVFFNAGHVGPGIRSSLDRYTHLELESLPSGGWGYMHFPTTVRYARRLGLPTLGMTGKFHVTWGHFSSFKSEPALEYESFVAVANGSAVSIGDQLHPRGELCPETYGRIGRVYSRIRDLEPWLAGAEAVTEIGVFNTEALEARGIGLEPALTGAVRTLLEGAAQFDVVDGEMDWSRYRAIVLPDKVTFDDAIAEKVSAYLRGGGAVLATYRSGLVRGRDEFAVAGWPVRYAGVPDRVPDFILTGPALAERMPSVPWVCYETGLSVEPQPGSEVLAETYEPYFRRAYDHFCSHFHTPIDSRSSFPSAVRAGRCVYLSHPHFTSYDRHGAFEDAQIARNALALLVPDPLVRMNAPSTCHVTLTRQPSASRRMVHILHYIPERRCSERDVVQDVIPLRDVELRLRVPRPPSECYLAPSRKPVAVSMEGGYARITVPEVRGYAVVVFEGVD